MQQVRPNRDPILSNGGPRTSSAAMPVVVRTDLSSLLNDYTNSQRHYNDRLESLEREMASLKGQVSQVCDPSADEHELNRTFTTRKVPTSARTASPSRIPLPVTPRKAPSDASSVSSGKTAPAVFRVPPMMAITRSKTFHNNHSAPSDEAMLLRSYKAHLEQVMRKEGTVGAEIRVPNYTSFEDVMQANEQLLLENERLRSELNRLKTESILLLRSMKTNMANDSTSGNERISAERERHELAIELARQVEENKRLRKSLLAQSEKFLTLRRSVQPIDASAPVNVDHRRTPESSSQNSLNSMRTNQSKSARHHSDNRGQTRPKSFYHGTRDPL